ncbi:MAG: AAA family ATPase [Woeseiaceae bacterium]
MSREPEAGLAQQRELIAALRNSRGFPHAVSDVEIVETHISWVVLTGQFAYKIKKAVNLGFLDFSTLERRRYFCEEELRLNRQWSPQLYIGMVSIGGSPDRPILQGEGEADEGAIEYALKMRQFPQDAQLDRQLDDGLLRQQDLLDLAETLAAGHRTARVIEYENDTESVGKVRAPILENFLPVERTIDMALLREVHRWTDRELIAMKPLLIQRRQDGFVRECHGDLHLANLVRLPDGIRAFDCIEFSPDLRNIDVMSDIAFLVMDLVARARQDLAYAFLNRYLEQTGDYGGMSVFGLYFVYHSMIRAKVAAIRSTDRDTDEDRRKDIDGVKHYLAVAVRWIRQPSPMLIGMHGYSGSGKTWLSSQLLTRLPAVRVRSDIERKRLLGLEETASTESAPGAGIYSQGVKQRVYSRLLELAGELLKSGFHTIVDAAFLKKTERADLAALAVRAGVPVVLVSTAAGDTELRRRLDLREQAHADASEATVAVLNLQRRTCDPLNVAEQIKVIPVSTDREPDADEIVGRIRSEGVD